MEVARIHVDQPEASPANSPLFLEFGQDALGTGDGFGVLTMREVVPRPPEAIVHRLQGPVDGGGMDMPALPSAQISQIVPG